MAILPTPDPTPTPVPTPPPLPEPKPMREPGAGKASGRKTPSPIRMKTTHHPSTPPEPPAIFQHRALGRHERGAVFSAIGLVRMRQTSSQRVLRRCTVTA